MTEMQKQSNRQLPDSHDKLKKGINPSALKISAMALTLLASCRGPNLGYQVRDLTAAPLEVTRHPLPYGTDLEITTDDGSTLFIEGSQKVVTIVKEEPGSYTLIVDNERYANLSAINALYPLTPGPHQTSRAMEAPRFLRALGQGIGFVGRLFSSGNIARSRLNNDGS